MFAEVTHYFNNVGCITRYESTKTGREIFVVEYYNSPYMNLFSLSKEKEALISLADNTSDCQLRDGNLPNFFLEDDEEHYFLEEFAEIYDEEKGDIQKSVEKFFEKYSDLA